jgi:hypothetical protein
VARVLAGSDRFKPLEERFAVGVRGQPVACSKFAILRSELAVCGRRSAMFCGLRALSRGTLSYDVGAHDEFRAGDRAQVVLSRRRFVPRERLIAGGGGVIARLRREVPGACDRVTALGGVPTRSGGLVAQTRRLSPQLATQLICGQAGARGEITITRSLIAVGSRLIAVSTRLIAVSTRLIAVSTRLITVRQRLIGSIGSHRRFVSPRRSLCHAALLQPLDRPILERIA